MLAPLASSFLCFLLQLQWHLRLKLDHHLYHFLLYPTLGFLRSHAIIRKTLEEELVQAWDYFNGCTYLTLDHMFLGENWPCCMSGYSSTHLSFWCWRPLQAMVTEEWTALHNSHCASLVIFLFMCAWATLTPHTYPFPTAQLTSSLAAVCCESRLSDYNFPVVMDSCNSRVKTIKLITFLPFSGPKPNAVLISISE